MDKHTLALISVIGSSLDLLGAMYLAYDLLGGEHGPLRTLTRAVTYGALFATGFGLALGPIFGLISGAAHGITLAWEYSRASRNAPQQGTLVDMGMSAIRGCGFTLGSLHPFGAAFGITFGVLSTAGQAIAYRLGIRPTAEYRPGRRPRVTRFNLLSAANRTVGYAAAGYASSLVAHNRVHAMAVGLKAGVAIGLVSAVVMACTPFVEWTADRMPARRMGVLGIVLILAGFALQSVQYWLTLMDVAVR